MIEDVEVFRPQLELPALGKVNVLGELQLKDLVRCRVIAFSRDRRYFVCVSGLI